MDLDKNHDFVAQQDNCNEMLEYNKNNSKSSKANNIKKFNYMFPNIILTEKFLPNFTRLPPLHPYNNFITNTVNLDKDLYKDLIIKFQRSFTIYFIYINNSGLAFVLSQLIRHAVQRTFIDTLSHTIKIRLERRTLHMTSRRIYICVDFDPLHLIKAVALANAYQKEKTYNTSGYLSKHIENNMDEIQKESPYMYNNICRLDEFVQIQHNKTYLRLPSRAILEFLENRIHDVCPDIKQLLTCRSEIEILLTFERESEGHLLYEWAHSYLYSQTILTKQLPLDNLVCQLQTIVLQHFNGNFIWDCMSVHVLLDFLIYILLFEQYNLYTELQFFVNHGDVIHPLVKTVHFNVQWSNITDRICNKVSISLLDLMYQMLYMYTVLTKNVLPSEINTAVFHNHYLGIASKHNMGEPLWFIGCSCDHFMLKQSRCNLNTAMIFWTINENLILSLEIMQQYKFQSYLNLISAEDITSWNGGIINLNKIIKKESIVKHTNIAPGPIYTNRGEVSRLLYKWLTYYLCIKVLAIS